jgi:hypothetical protein
MRSRELRMAVLVEGISVVVLRDAIDRSHPGGWSAFVTSVPNSTLCADDRLARVGFMASSDAERYVETLREAGLVFLAEGKAADIVVIDQQRGPTVLCDWIEFGHVAVSGQSVAACRCVGSEVNTLATPPGWAFEGSLSQRFHFVAADELERKMRFLRRENGLEVWLNLETGKEIYIAQG